MSVCYYIQNNGLKHALFTVKSEGKAHFAMRFMEIDIADTIFIRLAYAQVASQFVRQKKGPTLLSALELHNTSFEK